jgi:hypothetical protein
MGSIRIISMRFLPFPFQFLGVLLLSICIFIFLLGMSANSRIETRNDGEIFAWEKASLWACPLH